MKLTMTLLALCVVAALASCSKNKRGDILKYVPADATGMVYFNGEQIVGQAGVKDGKVGEPLKGALESYGVDLSDSDAKDVMEQVSKFTYEGVAFFQGKKVWVVAGMKDAKGFMKYLEKEQGFDKDKEDGIEYVSKNKGYLMFKDDMLFMCYNVGKGRPGLDTEGVKELCDLGDESFARNEKTKELAEKIKKGDLSLYALVNIDKVQGIVNDGDFDKIVTGLSAIYNNPKYASLEASVNDKGIVSTLKILDSGYKPAKCSLPVGKIDAGAFPYAAVQGNTMAFAVDVPSSIVNQALSMAGNMLPAQFVSILKGIDGTMAVTVNPNPSNPNDIAAGVVTTTGNQAAVSLGEFVQLLARETVPAAYNSSVRCSTSDKYLRISLPGSSPAGGSVQYAANMLNGKVAGVVVDLNTMVKNAGIGGDFGELGVQALYLEPAEGSLVLKYVWNCADPVAKSIKLAQALKGFDGELPFGAGIAGAGECGAVAPDSIAAYESYSYYDSVAPEAAPAVYEPEPDLYY